MGFLFGTKDQAFSHFDVFRKGVEKVKDYLILRISDRGGEFINHSFITYCEKMELGMNCLVQDSTTK